MGRNSHLSRARALRLAGVEPGQLVAPTTVSTDLEVAAVGQPAAASAALAEQALASQADAAAVAARAALVPRGRHRGTPQRRFRWRVSRAAAIAFGLVALAAAAVMVVMAWWRGPVSTTIVPLTPTPPVQGASISGPPSPPALVVHVAGQVAQPGVVTLPAGSRVTDAVAAAGGALAEANLAAVNLARPLVDGEQVFVPPPGPAPPGGAAGAGPPAGASGGKLNLNLATQAELEALPGIGPVTAGRIIAWRTEHKTFTSVEELGEVSGIGPKMLTALRDLVTV